MRVQTQCRLGVVAHTYNSSPSEVEVEGLEGKGQPGLKGKILRGLQELTEQPVSPRADAHCCRVSLESLSQVFRV